MLHTIEKTTNTSFVLWEFLGKFVVESFVLWENCFLREIFVALKVISMESVLKSA